MTQQINTYRAGPDEQGHFGIFGGRFVAETLMPLILEVEKAWDAARADPTFEEELEYYFKHYVGRPSPLYFAKRLTEHFGGAKIYFKRDELNHTGAHKINNCIGQILLARRMGKTRIIAETGAGQHGVATATVCALFDLPCTIYMGSKDIERQAPNVFRMKLLGAESEVGDQRVELAEGRDERGAARLGRQCRGHLLHHRHRRRPAPLPRHGARLPVGDRPRDPRTDDGGGRPAAGFSLVACIGGGSNAMGLFHPFLDEPDIKIIGVEAAGLGVDTDKHAASLTGGRPGVLHGNRTYLLQDDDGQILEAHSISAGLDYPGIGPEHSWLYETGRVEYVSATDRGGAGGLPALQPDGGHHPGAGTFPRAGPCLENRGRLPKDHILCMNMCGRGDKDIFTVADALGVKI